MRHPLRSYRVFVPVELHANPANAMTSMLQSTDLLSMRAVRLSAAIVAALAMPPAIAAAQSFDCRAARSADEMTICQNGDLARLDQQLAAAYRRDMAKLGQEQRDQFQQNEVSFLNARRRCGENQRCLEQSYHNRIQELRNLMSAGEERDGAAGALAVGE